MDRLYMQARDIISSFLDIFVPRNSRTLRTTIRKEEDIPLRHASHHLLDIEIITLMDYRDSVVQDLIRSLKYDGAGHSAHLCASILADFLVEEISIKKTFSTRPILLVPIPLHTTRKCERGFNQIEIVLQRLPKPLRDGTIATLAPQVLIRKKATRQQAHLARTERIKNVHNAFEIPAWKHIAESQIFLIDDVATTGATLASATKSLRKTGAKVTPIALARA